MRRQAASYREGRVLVAGDAAHVHAPLGGQGLNTGIQDAMNLGWKLAQVVDGTSPAHQQDTYQPERHPVGAQVQQISMSFVALSKVDARTEAVKAMIAPVLAMDEPRRHLGGVISGLDITYDLGGEHPLVGRRVPDLELVSADGAVRAFELLHEARPVLISFGGAFDASPWPRVRSVEAEPVERWELPVIGPVEAPDAVLVRPDGHVAWVGPITDPGLPEALTRWFGPPAAA
jgi:hypothetical protein